MILRLQSPLLVLISGCALVIFTWPLLGLPLEPGMASWIGFFGVLGLIAISALILDGELRGPKQLAMVAVLAALGVGVRVATGGIGGIELVFLTVILGGRAFGAKFGFLLGVATIALSSLFFGGFGPWTGYQMFATAWVAAGAGLLRVKAARFENLILALYGVLSSYAFGLLMNLWFWPVATLSSSLSYDPNAVFVDNLVSFFGFSLLSSTLGWDTVRAITLGFALLVFAKPALRALRRVKL